MAISDGRCEFDDRSIYCRGGEVVFRRSAERHARKTVEDQREKTARAPRRPQRGRMSAGGIVRRGLVLPLELYLQPERFQREIDALAGDERELTIRRALRGARTDAAARATLVQLLAAAAVALTWPALIGALLDLVGVPIAWPAMAVGVAFGVAAGVAFGVAGGVGGVAFGVAGAVAFGVAFGVAFAVAFGVALAVAFGVAYGVAAGVAFGVAGGGTGNPAVAVAFVVTGWGVLGGAGAVAFGGTGGFVIGVAFSVAFVVVAERVALAPLEVALAWALDQSRDAGTAASKLWSRHPARWDPHGRFPLPGLSRLLARLELEQPTLAIEAAAIVSANPTRRRHVVASALLVADRTVERANSAQRLASLQDDLKPLLAGDRLASGERAELELLGAVSREVSSALRSDSVANRGYRLGAARSLLDQPNPGSAVLARRRPAVTRVVEQAILAQGEDAERLGLQKSELEDLLGRDFRFALRALADDIPASPELTDHLLQRAIDELLDPDSRARFTAYRSSLLERIGALASINAGARAAQLLARRLSDWVPTGSEQQQFFVDVAQRCPHHPAVAKALSVIVAGDVGPAIRAARVLAGQGQLPHATIERLTTIATTSDNPGAASQAAEVLAGQEHLPEPVVQALVLIARGHPSYKTRVRAVAGLSTALPSEFLIESLADRLIDSDNDIRRAAGNALATLSGRHPEWRGHVASLLVAATEDHRFAARDPNEKRTGHDYAYDALWSLTELDANDQARRLDGNA